MLKRGLNQKLIKNHFSLIPSFKSFSLNLHEYQAQALLRKYTIPIPKGVPVFTAADVDTALNELGSTDGYAVKAQVLTGGRGLGYFKENNFKGGVHVVTTRDEVRDLVPNMVGKTLVTKQTGSMGIPCKCIYIVEKVSVKNEKYFSITLDRKYQGPVLIASAEGGVNIEETSEKNPDAIKILPIDIVKGLPEEQLSKFVGSLGYEGELATQAKDIIRKLYKCFMDTDSLMIEINPLATVNQNGLDKVMVIDSKVTIDENASFRQQEIASQIDKSNKKPIELEAEENNLTYIQLDGNIGCLVNGAGKLNILCLGLAMATMDIIKLHGGMPANFLDVGGGAEMEGMVEALRLLNSDINVKSILVNIFGGILRCDILVKAIISATEKYNLTKPIVLRLKGTNFEQAKQLISESKLSNITFCDDLDKAAKISVEKAGLL